MNRKTIYIVSAAIVAVAMLAGICIWRNANSPQSNYEKARKAILTGDVDRAEEYFAKAAKAVDRDETLASEAMRGLAECRAQKGDTAGAVGHMRDAALHGNREAQACYATHLAAHPELLDEYIAYYTALNSREPENCSYAAMLAKPYIFNEAMQNYDKAGRLLQPFVTRSGGNRGADVNAMAFAAHLMAKGLGGYPESPEGAAILTQACRSMVKGHLDDPAIDADALRLLAAFELVDITFNSNGEMLENAARALSYLRATGGRDQYLGGVGMDNVIEWLEKFSDEKSNVNLSPNWWDRKPADWTQFANADTGFKYVGHTNLSGVAHSWIETEYPTGWGYGAWTNEHAAFIGKWENGRIKHGLYITPDGDFCLQ